jgi:proteasome beta subunit
MGTVVALETECGVAIAGDTRSSRNGTVESGERRRVFDFGTVGVGVVGDGSAIEQFQHRFGATLRSREFETGREPTIETAAGVGAHQAEHANVDAAVAARDADGTPRLREVRADGAVLDGPRVALGSGATVALGRLNSTAPSGVDELAAAVRTAVAAASERDAQTGDDVDVWTLSDDGA